MNEPEEYRVYRFPRRWVGTLRVLIFVCGLPQVLWLWFKMRWRAPHTCPAAPQLLTAAAVRRIVREELERLLLPRRPEPSEVKGVAAAARLLGVSRSTIERWLRSGRLAVSRRVGRAKWISIPRRRKDEP